MGQQLRSLTSIPKVLLLVAFLSFPGLLRAETKTIIADATYLMGDGETPAFAAAMVMQRAKLSALEQAGTYVEAYTKVRDFDLTTEEIQTIAGGILSINVLEQNRKLVGDGLHFFIKIRAVVASDRMEELAQRIRGRNIAAEYAKLRMDYASLEREVKSLKELLARPRIQEMEKQVMQDRLRDQEKALAGIQRQEGTLFERLLSGPSLFARAEQQLAEKALRAQKQMITMEAIYHDIAEHGHEIVIGEPEIETRLGDQGRADLSFSVSIRANPSVREKVLQTRGLFSVDFGYAEYRKLEKRLESLSLMIEVVGQTVSRYVCSSHRHVSLYQGDGDFIAVREGPDHYRARISVPLYALKEMTRVRGKFVEDSRGDSCGLTRVQQ